MSKTIDTQVNKILIWTPTITETSIEEPREISKIVRLLHRKAEKCEDFVHIPNQVMFRIELYNNKKLLEKVAVNGDYLNFLPRGKDEWYFMQGLGKKLYEMHGKYLFG